MKHTLTCAAVAVGLLCYLAGGYPRPATSPVSWELQFEHGAPKRIVLNVPGAEAPQAYWYMLYTVTNPTRDEIQFIPSFDLLTHDGKVIQSDRAIPQGVFEAIKAAEKNKFLEPNSQVIGRLLPGEDEAKTGVAIWPEPAPRMETFSIFVAGLSGEQELFKIVDGQYIKVTGADDVKDPSIKTAIIRKTLQLKYQARGDQAPETAGQEWVMR